MVWRGEELPTYDLSLGRVDRTQEKNLPVPDALRGLSLLLLQFVDKSIKGFGAFHQEEPRRDMELGPEIGSSV